MQRPQLIIFTDLDGTLLDHHSYSWEPAKPALAQLQAEQIPLILTTSKTAAEVSKLHQELDLTTPYIIENGAGIILPDEDGTAHFFGKSYPEVIVRVQHLRKVKGYRFAGFNDLSVAQVMAETGLPEISAKLAKQRLCSEPIRWDDSNEALEQFRQDLKRHDLQLLRGGRFYHVLSTQADKGTALRWLLAHSPPEPLAAGWFSIALGDGPNDQAMLEAANLAVIIPSPSGLSPKPQKVTIVHAKDQGPNGWNQTVLEILKRHNKE